MPRNSKSKPTAFPAIAAELLESFGNSPISIDVPRDRDGSFTPLLIPKHERRFTGFDDKIVAMYARGMTIREIQGHARSAGRGISGNHAANLHCAPDPQLPGVRELEGSQEAGGRYSPTLHRGECLDRTRRIRCLRARPLGTAIPDR